MARLTGWLSLRWLRDALLGYDVFVSYAWSDGRSYAQALVAALRDRGYHCFLDDSEMPGGSELTTAVGLALRRSSALVVVATAQAMASPHVEHEVRTFAAFGRHLVPVFLDPDLRTRGTGTTLATLKSRVWLDEVARLRPDEPTLAILDRLAQTFRFVRRSRLRTAALTTVALGFATVAGLALLQLYRIETARRLSEAGTLARTQPTEAMLILAETENRWLADRSLLPQLTPVMVNASPTIRRHVVGDAVSGVAWLTKGDYTAVSTNGSGQVWNADGNQTQFLPPRLASTSDERYGFGSRTVPLSEVLTGPEGGFIATVDWHNCLRVFPTSSSHGVSDADTTRTCINRPDGEAKGFPFAFSPLGKLAFLQQGVVQFVDDPRGAVTLPVGRSDGAKEVVFDGEGRLHVRFSDGALLSVDVSGVVSQTEMTSQASGRCSDGQAWLITTGNEFVHPVGERGHIAGQRLAGQVPYKVSDSCEFYIDGLGDLYRASGPSKLVKRGLAVGWQYDAPGAQIAFSDRLVAVASHDGAIRVLDVETGIEEILLGHTQRLFQMVFNADGRLLLTGSFDGTVRVFDVEADFTVGAGYYPGSGAVYSAALDGEAVISTRAFDPIEELSPGQEFTVPTLDPRADQRLVAVRADWRHGDRFFLADGDTQYVAVCSAFGCPDGSELRKLRLDLTRHGGRVQARASADGDFLVVVDDQTMFHIFDLRRPGDRPVFSMPDEEIRSAAFSGRGERLFLLRGDHVAVLPFGPAALDLALRSKVKFCLTPEEREIYFGEWAFVASWRYDRCRSLAGLR